MIALLVRWLIEGRCGAQAVVLVVPRAWVH